MHIKSWLFYCLQKDLCHEHLTLWLWASRSCDLWSVGLSFKLTRHQCVAHIEIALQCFVVLHFWLLFLIYVKKTEKVVKCFRPNTKVNVLFVCFVKMISVFFSSAFTDKSSLPAFFFDLSVCLVLLGIEIEFQFISWDYTALFALLSHALLINMKMNRARCVYKPLFGSVINKRTFHSICMLLSSDFIQKYGLRSILPCVRMLVNVLPHIIRQKLFTGLNHCHLPKEQ